eukprot:213807_1
MAAVFATNFHYNKLLALNNEQLISTSIDLIDKASTDALEDSFTNAFRDSIMKYLLKIVIQQEINQLSSTASNKDWKRLSLIKKIAKLKETPPQINFLTPKNYSDKPKKIIKDEFSTYQLLVCGYIRNEMNIQNNNFPHDILSVCLHFIGNISNINNQQLMVFSVKDRQYSSPFSQQLSSKVFATNMNCKQFITKCSSTQMKQTLVAPNTILLSDESNTSNITYIHNLPHYPNASVLASNIQHIGQTVSSNTNHELFGMVQCLDIKHSRLLNVGGMLKTTVTPNYRNPPIDTTAMAPPLTYRSYKYKTQNTIYQINYDEKRQWDYAGMLIHGRGYHSLCDINHSKMAIIGGQKLIEPLSMFNYPSEHNLSMNCVELFDLENNNDNVTIKNLKYKRIQCGSYYNKYSNEMIAFGGNNDFSPDGRIQTYLKPGSLTMNTINNDISNSMEIYDFHKNIWIQVPYLSNKSYTKYPCIWTVGNKCIFVAKLDVLSTKGLYPCVEYEWIDLRVCGQNKSKFNIMNKIDLLAYDGCKENTMCVV